MAEVKVDMSIEADATPETLWKWMADIPAWPGWKPFIISSSYVKGKNLETGSVVKFKPKAGAISISLKATIVESTPPKRLAWEGGFPGLHAVHSFDFEDIGGGRTKITTKERFYGPAVFIFKLVFPPAKLEQMHRDWLDAFKNRAAKK